MHCSSLKWCFKKHTNRAVRLLVWLVVSVVIFLVSFELLLRVSGGVLGCVYRQRNIKRLAGKTDLTIMCVGESTTFNSYPRQLEEILSARDSSRNIKVIDTGIPGSASGPLNEAFERNVKEFKPDIVIFMIGINDSFALGDARRTKRSLWLNRLFRSRAFRFFHLWWYDFPNASGFDFHDHRRIRENWHDREKIDETLSRLALEFPGSLDVVDVSGKTSQQIWDEAEAMRARGEFKQALSLVVSAFKGNPDDPWLIWGKLRDILEYIANFPQTQELFVQVVRCLPYESLSYHWLGRYYFAQNNMDEAIKWWHFLVNNFKGDDDLDLTLGALWLVNALRQSGRYDELQHVMDTFSAQYSWDKSASYWGVKALAALERGDQKRADELFDRASSCAVSMLNPYTCKNYIDIVNKALKHNLVIFAMQYPMRSVKPLKIMLDGAAGELEFIDNSLNFRSAVRQNGFDKYFSDQFAGDFGHFTPAGSVLLAQNAAARILQVLDSK